MEVIYSHLLFMLQKCLVYYHIPLLRITPLCSPHHASHAVVTDVSQILHRTWPGGKVQS